jgi:hypothetical protein
MQKAFDKEKVRRDIERARRKQLKERLAELTELIAKARAERRERVKAVQLDCREKRVALRESCGLRRERAKATGDQEVEEGKKRKREARSVDRTIRNVDSGGRRRRSTAAERRQESDDEVRSNLEPVMVGVFDSVRKHIKGGPRRTRTEAFLEWAEENPDLVLEAQQQDADKYLRELLAEELMHTKRLKRKRVGNYSPGDEVPF